MLNRQEDKSINEGSSTIPEEVRTILTSIKLKGGEAYVVGGCVRDSILMRKPHDWDIATSMRLEELQVLFPKAKLVGKSFGVIKENGIDIATFRIDGKYSDGRHPDSVMFVKDIVQDLSRRDFTINAIAFDGERFVDPFNGMDCIRRGVIQTVNSAKLRFEEDALRMLRAFRFSSILGFNIANSTYKAIREQKELVRNVSKERIRNELIRMMEGTNLLGSLFSMSASGLLFEILQDLKPCKGFAQNKHHKYDVLEHSFRVADAVPSTKPLLRIAGLLHDIGKPVTCENYGKPDASFHNHEYAGADMAVTILEDLRFSNKEIEYITNLIRGHMFGYKQEMKNGAIRRLMRRVGKENMPDLMLLKYGDRVGNGLKDYKEFTWDTELRKRIIQIESEQNALKITDLKINGNDLIAIGIEQGPFMGKILKTCLDCIMEYPAKNTKQDLMLIVKELLDEYNQDPVNQLVEKEIVNEQ